VYCQTVSSCPFDRNLGLFTHNIPNNLHSSVANNIHTCAGSHSLGLELEGFEVEESYQSGEEELARAKQHINITMDITDITDITTDHAKDTTFMAVDTIKGIVQRGLLVNPVLDLARSSLEWS